MADNDPILQMELSTRIFLGLFAGVATGVFFGELVEDLKVFGDIFVKLLQMTVLPYIVTSLIAGFGRMTTTEAGRLARRGTAVLSAIWIIALALIFVAPLAFPRLDAASFFASPTIVDGGANSLLDLYVPSNIFFSLSNNMVPAVVVFSIFMGVALISVKEKDTVLPIFDGLSGALARINSIVVELTPFGIFAIAASAAGTMTVEELGRVQVYLVTYVALALLVTFWIFPGLVSAVSGIPYRGILTTFKDALVTAFATGNQFVVLPLIAENCKALLAQQGLAEDESSSAIDVIVPVSFNFPSLGKLLVLLFVLFAAWFTDTRLDPAQRLGLAFNGLFSLFGSINVAVPYLLDTLRIPTDMFQLFLVTGVVAGRFGALLAALHIVVVSLVGTLAMCDRLRLSWSALGRYLAVSSLAMLAMLLTLRTYFATFVPDPPSRQAVLAGIQPRMPQVETVVRTEAPAVAPRTERAPTGRRFDEILERGVLRVGYRPQNLPCTYLNESVRVLGFDADMANSLALDLGVDLEFVPFEMDALSPALDAAEIDIAMSCLGSLPDRYASAAFSRPYLELTLALVVPDHMRTPLSGSDAAQRLNDLTVALVASHYFVPRLKQIAPDVDIAQLTNAEDFFADPPPADALLLSAEEGAAYAFRHPRFSVITPKRSIKVPAAYALPRGEIEWHDVIGNWIEVKRADGSIDELYRYWMLGGVTKTSRPRWSIVRDVLGWVE